MISAARLLNAWEAGLGQNSVQRALTLLSLVWPDASRDRLLDLSIGQRDWHLLWLREQLFGQRLQAVARCPQCGESLELDFDVASIRVTTEPPAPSATLPARAGDVELQCRLPNSRDLLAIANSAQLTEARQELMARCLLDSETANLSDGAIQLLVAQLEQADPQADVQLDLDCPACQHQWLTNFDIASYLWSEINGWAVRLLREIHVLASTYGWHEADILAMSASRRQVYLQLIGV